MDLLDDDGIDMSPPISGVTFRRETKSETNHCCGRYFPDRHAHVPKTTNRDRS